MNEANAKKLLAKQLGDFAANLDSVGFLDVKTGRITGKMLLCTRQNMLYVWPDLIISEPLSGGLHHSSPHQGRQRKASPQRSRLTRTRRQPSPSSWHAMQTSLLDLRSS